MAKDPAFLFYPGDASNDTQFMNRLERGAYFDLVKGQRLFGGYTAVQLRKILGSDFESVWPALELVLEKDGDLYFIGWLRASITKREDYSKKQSERIKKRWNNGGNTAVLPNNVNENEIVNETVIITPTETEKKPRSKFVQPEYQEIESYMRERNSVAGGVWKEDKVVTEAKKYFNYYQSNGWRVGKNPMKDWQAAARNWMNNANQYTSNTNGRQQQQADSADHRARKEQILRGAFGQSNGFANEEPASQEYSAGS